MHLRSLGNSGIQASSVGLGAWALGGWMWGGNSESESIAAIHAALDAGMNLIDTAPIYGFGRSEKIVGKAIQGRRDQAVLATKCAMICDPTRGKKCFNSDAVGINEDGIIAVHVFCGKESIRNEIEGSLRRLSTDYIDLYQTHWQDSTTPIEETMATLEKLKEEGKIRAVGVSNASAEDIEQYRAVGTLDADQESYSMLDRNMEQDRLPYCAENNIAFLAYSPLARGLLTGKVGPERSFSETDQRYNNPRFSVENRRRVTNMLEKMRPITEQLGCTLSQLVIAWTIHQHGATHALVGARNPQQAEENAVAGDIRLTEEHLRMVAEMIDG
ncbi:MAG: aldo/keto reductase [Pirellulales bacterium]|nr:aldo/keto reductase [Pirellulales bacterium]